MEPSVLKPDPADELATPERCFILEASNGDRDEALSIARARVPSGVTTAWHAVDGADERYVILEGRGTVEVGPPNDPLREDVTAGDVVLIPSGTPQRIRSTGDGDLVFYALCTPRFRSSMYRSL